MAAMKRPDARYFSGVPHIVIYGAYDDKDEKCWILLWRQGKSFHISVDVEDVKDTAFYHYWRPLIQEDSPNRFDQFESLCDLIIITSMELLEELAPVQLHWQTIADYLHTPRYMVKLATQSPDGAVKAQVTDGPSDVPPYSLKPAQLDDIASFAGRLPQYDAGDLQLLDANQNWRSQPSKVQTSEGQIHHFLACEKDAMRMPEKVITNHAWDKIAAFIRVSRSLEDSPDSWPGDIPAVTGIALDNGLLAGILLTPTKDTNPLGKISNYQNT